MELKLLIFKKLHAIHLKADKFGWLVLCLVVVPYKTYEWFCLSVNRKHDILAKAAVNCVFMTNPFNSGLWERTSSSRGSKLSSFYPERYCSPRSADATNVKLGLLCDMWKIGT